MSKKVSQANEELMDEQRKAEEIRLRKEDELRRKREEYKESINRAQMNREQAEEGKITK
jgi:hypothetical protein